MIPRAIVDTIAAFAIQLSVLSYLLKLLPSRHTRRWLHFLVIYWSVCSATWLIYLAIWFSLCWPFWNKCEETIGISMLALTCVRIVGYIMLFIAARSVVLKSGSFLRHKRPVLLASLFCFMSVYPCSNLSRLIYTSVRASAFCQEAYSFTLFSAISDGG